MRIHLSLIPQEIIDEYKAMEYVDIDGYVYCEITGAMYGLAQSGRIANQDLQKHLAQYGYYPARRTPGLWKHRTRKINFTLVVDDFGIKYTNKNDIDHLIDAIKEKYPIKIDWEGSKYIGIDLKWDYTKREVHTIDERICNTSIKAIPTPNANQTPLRTNQVHTSGIWKKDPI